MDYSSLAQATATMMLRTQETYLKNIDRMWDTFLSSIMLHGTLTQKKYDMLFRMYDAWYAITMKFVEAYLPSQQRLAV